MTNINQTIMQSEYIETCSCMYSETTRDHLVMSQLWLYHAFLPLLGDHLYLPCIFTSIKRPPLFTMDAFLPLLRDHLYLPCIFTSIKRPPLPLFFWPKCNTGFTVPPF